MSAECFAFPSSSDIAIRKLVREVANTLANQGYDQGCIGYVEERLSNSLKAMPAGLQLTGITPEAGEQIQLFIDTICLNMILQLAPVYVLLYSYGAQS